MFNAQNTQFNKFEVICVLPLPYLQNILYKSKCLSVLTTYPLAFTLGRGHIQYCALELRLTFTNTQR